MTLPPSFLGIWLVLSRESEHQGVRPRLPQRTHIAAVATSLRFWAPPSHQDVPRRSFTSSFRSRTGSLIGGVFTIEGLSLN